MPIALTAFRDKYVWQERNNTLFELNLEGIMEVFCNPLYYIKNVGFTIESAQKLLKAMGCLVPSRMIHMQFDLAQMTVIDESVNAAEYDDMEFVEFLEFIIRIAFHQHLGQERKMEEKLQDFLRDMLALSNQTMVELPAETKKTLQTQATDEDIQAFHRYITKGDSIR